MSRLHLIIIILFLGTSVQAQSKLGKYLDFAKKQYDKGDYYYALEYYRKAMDLDSQSVDIVWQYAETLRAYKDYRKAEYYYKKVYSKEEARIYPSSLLYVGLMEKMNGKYDKALETFKKAKKKYYKDKKGYLYRKAKQEIGSTVWAKGAILDTNDLIVLSLPDAVNTKNAEFGHLIIDGQLIFSSLRADSISALEEVYGMEYSTSLYRSEYSDGAYKPSERIEALFKAGLNNGNGTLSIDSSRYYFSRCADDGYNYRCKIMVAYYENGDWSRVDSLGEVINQPGANTTMPSIAKIEGEEFLIFASDKEGGVGGLDLFYSQIINGNQFKKVQAIRNLNSIDNEVTPWWDSKNNRLYYSSQWENGFGGYDVFYSNYTERGFSEPQNVGLPVNSPANDLYYFQHQDTAYVSTNRVGVRYSKNTTCCSDILALIPPAKEFPPTKEETLADLNKRLPVTLYFHNDRPNPDSWDTTTTINYIDAYDRYTSMLDKYKKEYSKGLSSNRGEEAKEEIESFFIEYVDKGVDDLQLFRDLLLEELQNGAKLNITIQGFASPLAKTDYNVNLTKRRISSLLNYLRAYENGVFLPYLDGTAANGGQVVFSQIPFGEYTANQLTSDNPNDVQHSVYSRAAAIERKIEIQSVSYLDDNRRLPVEVTKSIIDLGFLEPGEKANAKFEIRNVYDSLVTVSLPYEVCPFLEVKMNETTIEPGQKLSIQTTFDSIDLMGHIVRSFKLRIKGFEQFLEFYISAEIKNE